MAQGTLPGFISALRAGLRPVALRNVLRASPAHPSFPFSYISGFIDNLKAANGRSFPISSARCGAYKLPFARKKSLFERHGINKPGGDGVALRFQDALVLRRNGPGNGQSQAETGFFSPGAIHPVEPLEQPLQLLSWNGLAGVGDGQLCLSVRGFQGQVDSTSIGAVLDSIVQQDGDKLPQLVALSPVPSFVPKRKFPLLWS